MLPSKSHDKPPKDETTNKHTVSGSARNGRMLDLDALLGDHASSRANKERSQTGNRQSRFINSSPTFDLGGSSGKRLHIQGFIPIVGVRDVTESGQDELGEQFKQPKRHQPQVPELSYAQSSIGHASFVGVQRYLNSGDQTSQDMGQTKSSSVIENIKKPIKKLTGSYFGNEVSSHQSTSQRCFCVPFYMCKNGYLSNSSLGKSQIQQLINQQHPSSNNMRAMPTQRPYMSELITAPSSFAESYPSIDERSLDQKPLETSNHSTADNSGDKVEPTDQTVNDGVYLRNSSVEVSEGEFSDEILGRMLGLKSSSSSQSSGQQQAIGTCGLLRSCCSVPDHLLEDSEHLRLISQLEQHPVQPVRLNGNQVASQVANMARGPHQQVVVANQGFQSLIQQPLPYGLPAAQLAQAHLNAQAHASNAFSPSEETLLAHRSSQFQQLASSANPSRYQQQVAQYTRAAHMPLQSMQPYSPSQQGLSRPVNPMQPLGSISLANQLQQQQALPAPLNRNLSPTLGSRKILEGRCGLRQSSGITGRVQALQYPDSSADFGEYPAQAAILKRLSGSDSLFVCGGTLISQYWIATAAHCIKKYAQTDLKVRLGEWDVHRDDEFYPYVEKEIRDLVIHPEFVAGNLVNDLALLRLDSPVDPSLPHVNPACLPNVDESFARNRCWVTGWGKDSFGQKGSFQAVLREVELPVIGQAECESALRHTRLGPHYRLHSGFICAGGEGGRDACEGDGGSGLYCIQDGLIKVAGLVSWGIGCGQAGVPGVYVSMAHYRPWIENIISIDEDIYSSYNNLNGLISERNVNSTETSEVISNSTLAARA